MAFSLRKMLSNINYFTKPGDDEKHDSNAHNKTSDENDHQERTAKYLALEHTEFDRAEADSTSKCGSSFHQPPTRHRAAKKDCHSDTDLLNTTGDGPEKKKYRKLKVDVEKASESTNNSVDHSEDSANLENTPKHKLLDCRSADFFKGFNFNQSFDILDAASVASSNEEEMDIESLSDHSDTDISEDVDDKSDIKMCRKVVHQSLPELAPSATPESFVDIEVYKNEEERISLLLNYQTRLEKLESFLKKLLAEFQFHIEVSKVFNCKSLVSMLPGANFSKMPQVLNEMNLMESMIRGTSPAGWSVVTEKEDENTKTKLKNQLLDMRNSIDDFVNTYLSEPATAQAPKPRTSSRNKRHLSHKKKMKHFDFPDLRDAFINLFSPETLDLDGDQNENSKCFCNCHSSELESPKCDKSTRDISITSSIGNFSLDATTLSAYSESLDRIVSFDSFDATFDLYNAILQKSAIERLTFYIQVHSIQLKCENYTNEDSKAAITFFCPTCNITEFEEDNLLRHILSYDHCEKIHFIYKTAYVKKCIQAGKEIQPSTILNPMTMYRDDNKIVCFGDAMYACSLCFENLIVGESVLIAHCSQEQHANRREMLADVFDD